MTPAPGTSAVTAAPAGTRTSRRIVAIGLAALLVAASAQVVVPVPFSPVPMTLQPLAVLVVGALLGPAAGAGALIAYLMAGVAGLPVFSAGRAGAAWLVGPTGGYLLAFPVAAALVGVLAPRHDGSGRLVRLLVALAAGTVAIHAGGVAHLALLSGDPVAAYRIGFVPFITGDLLKIGLAAAIVILAGPAVRSRL